MQMQLDMLGFKKTKKNEIDVNPILIIQRFIQGKKYESHLVDNDFIVVIFLTSRINRKVRV